MKTKLNKNYSKAFFRNYLNHKH